MSPVALLLRTVLYLLSLSLLFLAAWTVVRRLLPRGGVVAERLAVVLLVGMALNAAIVQTLGLVGLLNPGAYMGVLVVVSAMAFALCGGFRAHSLLYLMRANAIVFITKSPWGIGYVAVMAVSVLAHVVAVVNGTDTLSLHGPAVVEWIQSGRVTLGSFWNYPLCWEYQYVPNFLLLTTDVLSVVPRVIQTVLLVLVVRSVARSIGLGARPAVAMAWFCTLTPLLWTEESMKADAMFGAALLLGVVGVCWLWSRRRGAWVIIQLATFFAIGTKPTGFVYGGLILGAALLVDRIRRRPAAGPKRAAAVILATVAIQSVPAAVQIANLIRNGSPVYPIEVSVFGRSVLPGFVDLTGTSIADNAGSWQVWRSLSSGAGRLIGHEFPLLLLGLMVLTAVVVVGLVARAPWVRPVRGAPLMPLILIWVLWGLFIVSPWSCGAEPGGFQYVASGTSLRYATAAWCLTYLAVAAAIFRWARWSRVGVWLTPLLMVLLAAKWMLRKRVAKHLDGMEAWASVLLTLAAIAVLLLILNRSWSGRDSARRLSGIVIWGSAILTAGLALTAFSRHVEVDRERLWMPMCRSVWQNVWSRDIDGLRIAINRADANFKYMFYGRRLSNRLIPLQDFAGQPTADVPADVDLLVVKISKRKPRGDLALLERHELQDWSRVARCQRNMMVLLARGEPAERRVQP